MYYVYIVQFVKLIYVMMKLIHIRTSSRMENYKYKYSHNYQFYIIILGYKLNNNNNIDVGRSIIVSGR